MRLVIIREHDGETFDLAAYVNGAYVLDKSATIPGGTSDYEIEKIRLLSPSDGKE